MDTLTTPGLTAGPIAQERQFLTCILIFPEYAHQWGVTAEDFELDEHRQMFELQDALRKRDLACNGHDLGVHLFETKPRGWQQTMRALNALLNANDWPVPEYAERLLNTLRIRRATRQVQTELAAGHAELAEPFVDPKVVSQAVANRLADAADRVPGQTPTVSQIVSGLKDVSAVLEGDQVATMATGVPRIDSQLGGLSSEGVTLVIGSSGMGKTTFINRLLIGMARQGLALYVHGTETTPAQRVNDLCHSLARVPQRTNGIGDVERAANQLNRARQELCSYALEVTGSGAKLEEVQAKAHELHRRGRLHAMFVDYVQDFPIEKGFSQLEWVMRCSQSLKDLAGALDVPVVVAAQAKPKTLDEAKRNPRHGMWSAQWASKLPQDAEEVWVLYRSDVYAIEFGDAWTRDGNPGELEVMRKKSRKGGQGNAFLSFDGPTKWIGDGLREYKPLPAYGF